MWWKTYDEEDNFLGLVCSENVPDVPKAYIAPRKNYSKKEVKKIITRVLENNSKGMYTRDLSDEIIRRGFKISYSTLQNRLKDFYEKENWLDRNKKFNHVYVWSLKGGK